jgi:thiamine-phosphate pyrophosphorylase
LIRFPLYPILDASFEGVHPAGPAVRALARAGCPWVQLRAKELSSGRFLEWAREAVEEARAAGIQLLVNDRADVALLAGADGVHLGQDDLPPEAARELLGTGAVIGLSTHSLGEAEAAGRSPVDYVAIGPVFETRSKESPHRPLGAAGVAEVRRAVTKPLVAIGGITAENGGSVLRAGADSLAVISALDVGGDLERSARRLLEAWGRSAGS